MKGRVFNFALLASLIIGYALPAWAQSVTVYKSTGSFGEMKFSQIAPKHSAFETLIITLPTTESGTQTTTNQRCATLRQNLATLNAGGIIHEIDAQGNKTRLSDREVAERKAAIKDALNSCDQSS